MYFVLVIDQYYPRGGVDDSVLNTNDLPAARRMNNEKHETYADDGLKYGYILDGSTGEQIDNWQGTWPT